jgi:murein DD-endopeptidase MepM/ murein hydrolase activator NlpD
MVWKPHNGTDYAAPSGTPIKSTAAGVVERTGYTTGNGNFVKVKHDKTYATQYLHMSRILAKQGQRVQQGQVIGLVGSTGLATGPHVCYRFWKNGAEVDPFKLKLPNTVPIDGSQRQRFINYMTPLKRQLDSVSLAKGIKYVPPKVDIEKPEPEEKPIKKKKRRQ